MDVATGRRYQFKNDDNLNTKWFLVDVTFTNQSLRE